MRVRPEDKPALRLVLLVLCGFLAGAGLLFYIILTDV